MSTNNNCNNLPNPFTVSEHGTDVQTLTSHGLIYGNGTSAFTSLASATNGQLPIGSTSAAPVLGTISATGSATVTNGAGTISIGSTQTQFLVLISTQTASNSASLTWTSGISGTYNTYFMVFTAITPATSGVTCSLTVSANGGSSYASSGYESAFNATAYTTTTYTNNNATSSFIITDSTLSSLLSGSIWLYNLSNGNDPYISGRMAYFGSAPTTIGGYLFGNVTTTSINALKIAMSSGNITSGTVSLYGLIE
jgi:hypothetical protein